MADKDLDTSVGPRARDSWPRRLVRPLVSVLAATPVTPNQVTSLRLGLGAAACGLVATGSPQAAVWGAAFWLLCVLLDRVDGELARMTATTSDFGHRLDYACDLALGSAFFVALGIGQGGAAVWMGVAAGAAMLAAQVAAEVIDRAQTATGEKAFRGFAGFDPEDSHAGFAVVVLLEWEPVFLSLAAVGAPLFAIYSLARMARLQRGRIAAVTLVAPAASSDDRRDRGSRGRA